MKRLTLALLIAAAFSAPSFASTPTEREMNEFGEVSQTKAAPAHHAAEGAPSSKGYNKAIEEHKLHMAADDEGSKPKHGKKSRAKKHHHKAEKPAN